MGLLWGFVTCRRWDMGKRSVWWTARRRWDKRARSGASRLFRAFIDTFEVMYGFPGEIERGTDNLYNNNIYIVYKVFNNNNNNNNNHSEPNATGRISTTSASTPVRASSPTLWGELFYKECSVSPIPSFPPNYMRTPHPGIRPTKQHTHLRDHVI